MLTTLILYASLLQQANEVKPQSEPTYTQEMVEGKVAEYCVRSVAHVERALKLYPNLDPQYSLHVLEDASKLLNEHATAPSYTDDMEALVEDTASLLLAEWKYDNYDSI